MHIYLSSGIESQRKLRRLELMFLLHTYLLTYLLLFRLYNKVDNRYQNIILLCVYLNIPKPQRPCQILTSPETFVMARGL